MQQKSSISNQTGFPDIKVSTIFVWFYARVQIAIPQTGPQMVKTDHNWHILSLLRQPW